MMGGQPNLPDEAQEKIQQLQEMQDSHEELQEALASLRDGLESATRAQEFIENVPEDTTVHRQVDELLFEMDYGDAQEHIDQKVADYEEDIERLGERHEQLEEQMEELGQEVQEMMQKEQSD